MGGGSAEADIWVHPIVFVVLCSMNYNVLLILSVRMYASRGGKNILGTHEMHFLGIFSTYSTHYFGFKGVLQHSKHFIYVLSALLQKTPVRKIKQLIHPMQQHRLQPAALRGLRQRKVSL